MTVSLEPRTKSQEPDWIKLGRRSEVQAVTAIRADEFICGWSRAEFDLASSGWLPIIRNNAGHRPGRDSRPPGHCPSRRQFTRREHSRTGGDTSSRKGQVLAVRH